MRKKDKIFIAILGGTIAAIIFILIYGIKILDFTNDRWLIDSGGDLAQHYLGWMMYRNSEWNFPIIGLNKNLVYPTGISIVYTDSIPLFAIIFKIFSKLLPDTFQYFGLFGLMCYILQGSISSMILYEILREWKYSLIGSIFFSIATPLLQRLFLLHHTALGAQWIILLSIYIYILNIKNNYSTKWNVLVWSTICIIAVSIHMYFLPMVYLILVAQLGYEIYSNKNNIRRAINILLITSSTTLVFMYILGMFMGNTNSSIGGLGIYNSNIGLLFNPQGFSKYLKSFPTATEGQYEGMVYLGLGIIVLLSVAVILIVYTNFNNSLNNVIMKNKRYIPLIFVTLICIFIAYSPIITSGTYTLLTIPYPKFIINMWSIFRASGRFMWVPMYLLFIAVIVLLYRKIKNKLIVYILVIMGVILQFLDESKVIQSLDNIVEVKSEKQLISPIWTELRNKYGYKNMILMRENEESIMKYYSDKLAFELEHIAAINDMTLNDGYIARLDLEKINKQIENEYKFLNNNKIKQDNIYIFCDELDLYNIQNTNIYFIDGIYICDPLGRIKGYDDYLYYKKDFTTKIMSKQDIDISSEQDGIYVPFQEEIDLKSNTIYKIELELEVNKKSKNIYFDFYSIDNYDNIEQQKNLIIKNGSNKFIFYINSGDVTYINNKIYARIVSEAQEKILIKSISIYE